MAMASACSPRCRCNAGLQSTHGERIFRLQIIFDRGKRFASAIVFGQQRHVLSERRLGAISTGEQGRIGIERRIGFAQFREQESAGGPQIGIVGEAVQVLFKLAQRLAILLQFYVRIHKIREDRRIVGLQLERAGEAIDRAAEIAAVVGKHSQIVEQQALRLALPRIEVGDFWSRPVVLRRTICG